MVASLRWHLCAAVSALLLLALLSPLDSPHSSGESSLTPSLLGVRAIKRKLTEKELGEIEDQWMEDEEEDEDDTPFKYKRTPEGGRLPPSPSGPKTEMGFVTLKGSPTKKQTDELAGRWADQMMAAGIDTRGYTIEDNRILFVCDQRGYKDMNRVRAFLLLQPETEEFEWNNKKSRPGDVVKDEDGGVAVDDPLAKFQAMQDEAAAAQKRAARAKKKAEKEKKRRAEKERKRKERERKRKQKEEEEKKKQKQAQQQESKKEAQKQQPATGATAGEAKPKDEL